LKTYVLHQSQLNDYLRCPELFRRKYLGQIEDGPTDSTAIGTAMHTYAEQRILGRSRPVAAGMAYETYDTEEDHPLFRYVKVAKRETAFKHLAHVCAVWEHNVLPQLGDPVYVEQKFSLQLDLQEFVSEGTPYEIEIVLEGTIDFADWSIKDWKTASDGRKYQAGYGGEGWQLQRYGIQPTTYCWAALQLGDLDDPLTFDYVAVEKTQPNVHWLRAERGEADFNWLRRLCWNVVGMLESDVAEWPLNDQSALCSEKWCPAWDTCKGAPFDVLDKQATISKLSVSS